MRRQELTVLSTVIIVSLFLAARVLAVGGDMGVGTEPLTDGSETYPYLIEDLADFDTFAGDTAYWAAGVHTKLMTDIDLSGRTYTTAVIAPDTNNTNYTFDGIPFSGIFDGAGYRVSNLAIDDGGVGNDYLGLIGKTENGQINNLSIENVSIRVVESSFFIGGLIGLNDTATVTNCHVSGEIIAERYASLVIGGMIGRNIDGEIANCNTANNVYPGEYTGEVGGLVGSNENGIITNCYTTGTVSGKNESYELGGLIGRCNDGTITDCYTTGNVSGYGQIGGLVGHNVDNIVTNCYATGAVAGENWTWAIGGLIGENAHAQINNCHATGMILGEHRSSSLGGLIGYNNGWPGGVTVTNCFATGTVTGGDFSDYLGGLIGNNSHADTIGCYATGAVTSGDNSDSIGGLIGENDYSSYRGAGTVSNCYATGEVLVGNNSQNIGGFAGYINNVEHIDGFWNIETSGLIDGVGNISPDPEGVMGKTTVEMQTQNTFTDAGWDFSTPIWVIEEGVDYPHLWWEIAPGPVDLAVELGETINGLELPAGIQNSLQVKLDGALKALEDDNENNDSVAINSLQAFINAVNAQRGKAISEEDADNLIATAQQIIDMLSIQ